MVKYNYSEDNGRIDMFNGNYIFNQKMTGENRLPARTLTVPADKPDITHRNCEESARMQCLDGEWSFLYLTEDDGKEYRSKDIDDSQWDKIPVPSMWQYLGYGKCLYPNVQYPFPYDPPYIHADNPVGIYRCHFWVNRKAENTVIRFLGVDNAYFVYLNGEYVGFSKGSRIAAEFDITDYLIDGENILTVKVYTYSDASYLENQDMLLASGIFRSVWLVFSGRESLWDYTAIPDKEGFTVNTEMRTSGNSTLSVSLFSAEGEKLFEDEHPSAASDTFRIKLNNPVEWNAEHPYLYTLVFKVFSSETEPEIHTKKVGICIPSTEGNKFLINGKPVFLKGVNRHDNNPFTGRAITNKQIYDELCDIKSCNLNAVRCSHYPRHPYFYEAASELGIYVMDEADNETHGAHVTGDQGTLNKDPEWYEAFFDRLSRMYYQDKNETCITIWSVGNESGEGENNYKCSQWLDAQAVRKPQSGNPPGGFTQDFRYTGYMDMKTLSSFDEDGAPVMMTEYGHAMGNSPGGLADIWKYVYTHQHICGGYAWEYKNHGFYEKGRNGKARYLYGGDFGDAYHWSNFSLDGFHTSDGTPKPSWDELRQVSAPVFADIAENGISVMNTLDFTDLRNTKLSWKIFYGEKIGRSGTAVIDFIPVHGTKLVPIDLSCNDTDEFCFADFVFIEGDKEIGRKSLILKTAESKEAVKQKFDYKIKNTSDNSFSVTTPEICIDFRGGMIAGISAKGKKFLALPVRPNLFRAPTDNDGIVNFMPRKAELWTKRLVNTVRFGEHSTEISRGASGLTIETCGKILPQGECWGFDVKITYSITKPEEIRVKISGKPYGNVPSPLPRIGLVFPIAKEFDTAGWFGRGPGDSYPDRKDSTLFGEFSGNVENMNFIYDVPQETGNHEDTYRVTLTSPDCERSIVIAADEENPKLFSFSYHPFTLENLTAARHCDELERSEENYLYIDRKVRGLGSNSCGPEPEEEYELKPEPFEFSFVIRIK